MRLKAGGIGNNLESLHRNEEKRLPKVARKD
jgi:hypothetical protein